MKRIFVILILPALLFAPQFSMAQNNNCGVNDTDKTVALTNPLSIIGICTPGDLVVKVIQLFASIVAVAAIAFTVFSGFKLIIATNEEAIKSARESITWSLGGFVVALLSFTIISGAAKLLGFDPGLIGQDTLDTVIRGPADPRDFWSFVNFVMVNFLALVGVVTIFMIIYYGYRYITAAGNEESIEQAKTGLKWAIVGFIITILAFTLVSSVQRLLLSGAPN